MDFSFSGIITQILFGGAGLYFFKEGKRNADFVYYFAGLVFLIAPSFSPSALWTWGIGAPVFWALIKLR